MVADGAAAPACQPGSATERPLEVLNRDGSVEHYFHFVLGFMAPLLLREAGEAGVIRLVRSCGPMDVHLEALRLPDVRVLPKPAFQALIEASPAPVERLHGLDAPEFFDAAKLRRLRQIVLRRFDVEEAAPGPALLMINRGKSPDFYQSAEAEKKKSAGLRRSVPNMAELHAAVLAAGFTARLMELENATLHDQVRLFARTRTLVAQHGAALVNMLWMPAGGSVVEINPMLEGTKYVHYFRDLAAACGLGYACVRQSKPHAAVEVGPLLEEVRKSVLF